jgi:hypothetical protein
MSKPGKKLKAATKEPAEGAQGAGVARFVALEIVDGQVVRRDVFEGTVAEFNRRLKAAPNR